MIRRLDATIHGRVQGVNFRYYTQREARRLNLVGWVANQRDGTVRSVTEGPEPELKQFLVFLHHGSPSARVVRVVADWQEATGEFNRFSVRWL